MLTKKQLFTRGMLDISPHMLSVIPFGIICGAIGVELGFHPYLVYAMSFIIFGGASQIVFLQLLSGCLLYTSPSPRDRTRSRMPSSA